GDHINFFFQAEDGIRDFHVTGVQTCALPICFEPQKTVRRTRARFADVTGAWSPLSGVAVQGYEIHSGQTAQHPAMAAKGDVARRSEERRVGKKSRPCSSRALLNRKRVSSVQK